MPRRVSGTVARWESQDGRFIWQDVGWELM